jgi:FkbM family methyltransferase
MLINSAKYLFTRVLQKAGLSDLQLKIAPRGRAIIPNPPLVLKAFTTKEGANKLLADPSLQLVLDKAKVSKTFWDVGANIGLFSILARDANPQLEIVSIEASTDFYQVLCRNWQINPDRWMCLHVAIGDREGPVQMSRGLRGCDHVLSPGELGSEQQREQRPMLTLDHLAQLAGHDRIDLLKIDVEGMEFAVLRGASSMLDAGRIGTIVLEADQHDLRYGTANQELVSFLASKGYRLDTSASVMGKPENNCQVFAREALTQAG